MTVNDRFTDLVADEPPYALDVEGALRSGTRRRRVRRTAAFGSLALSIGAVTAGVELVSPGGQAVVLAPAASPTAAAEPNDGSLSYRIVRANTPASWSITDMQGDDLGSWYANVDDGRGAQRVGLSVSKGGLQLHPCSDSEYVDHATCTETELSPTSRLIVRGASHDGKYSSVYAEIVHPNGYGVEATIDNATWKDIPKGTVLTTPEEKRQLSMGTVVNPVPLYSTDELIAIVKQMDAAQS